MDHELQVEPTKEEKEKIIQHEYTVWKKNSPFLYDLIYSHAMEWPSLTCQWFPDVESRPDKNYKIQRLLLGTHTNDEEPNYLQIASVQLPNSQQDIDMRKYEESTNEVGGHGATNEAHVRITQKIVHDGEVNRARYQYENPNIIATKAKTGDVYIFDRTTHESFPRENERFNPALQLKGHTHEGFGLAWNPHHSKSSHVLSAGFDSLVCEWDINAATKEHRTLQPLRTYAGHTACVADVAWHLRHNSIFASVGDDKQLLIWDSRDDAKDTPLHSIHAHDAEVNCVGFCPGNEWIIATGSSDTTAALWDMRNLGVKMHSLKSHTSDIVQLGWSPHHDTILATVGIDRRALVWDVARIGDESPEDPEHGPPELLYVHGGHTSKISDFGWNPAEPWVLASTAEDNIVQLWQMSSNFYEQESVDQEIEH
ncbi:WD40-repeat-containing domain protein [Spinellus fusiger]|nr:WD40-repeat-containing domain protein [Spinellus fusiger]